MLCQYCGRLATYKFNNGIYCCSTHQTKCPAQQAIRRETRSKKTDLEKSKSIEKSRNTKILRHGNPTFNNRESAKKTNIEKYGLDNVSKVESIKLKKDDTFNQNYRQQPMEHERLIQKKQETWKLKDMAAVNQKRVDTCIEKYGVSNPLQVLEIFEKTQKIRWKNFTFPSGRQEKIQGAEQLAIVTLLDSHHEDEIVVDRKDIPSIWYEFAGKRRRYYPDIFLKSVNKIIEVKSDFTYLRDLEKNHAKRLACIVAGYKFEFWVYTKNQLEIL